MAITTGELKMYRAAGNTPVPATNGGVISSNEIVTAIKNNIFPDVTQAERSAGLTRWRKVFCKNANSSNPDLELFNSQVFMTQTTPGFDWVYFVAGTQIDFEDDIAAGARRYGCAPITTTASAGATEIKVTVENVADLMGSWPIFQNGDTIILIQGSTSEYAEISGTPSAEGGGVYAITVTAATANEYTAAAYPGAAYVCTVYEPTALSGSVLPTYDYQSQSGTGTFTHTDNITLRNVNCIPQRWTLEIVNVSTQQYEMTGTAIENGPPIGGGELHVIGSGDHDYPAYGVKILDAAWAGTWELNDVVIFDTYPCAIPIFIKQEVPSGCASQSGNNFKLKWGGESS